MIITRYEKNSYVYRIRKLDKKDGEVIRMELVLPREKSVKRTRLSASRIHNLQNYEKSNDTFEQMIKAGEAFKKALGISDDEIYDLLKKRG